MEIRSFEKSDLAQLIELMQDLAAFEGYLEEFTVTESELESRGLCDDPEFYCLVAVQQGQVQGYLVYLRSEFTFNLKPNFVMKELFVAEPARGQRIGDELISALKQRAVAQGIGNINWLVLPQNHAAKRFYQRQGGAHDVSWEWWQLRVS